MTTTTIPKNSHKCKGAAGQPCTQSVTYVWTPVYSLTNKDKKAKASTEGSTTTAYLTCALGHTNPYTINGHGEIIG